MAKFRFFIRNKSADISLKDIENMDEVPVTFYLLRSYTVNEKGKQDISIITTGVKFFCVLMLINII